MSEYSLNLFEDRLGLRDEATWPLGEGYRIIYVVEGEVDIAGAAGHSSTHGQNSAWLGTGACVARATTDQTRLWRWDLVPGATGGRPAEDSVAAASCIQAPSSTGMTWWYYRVRAGIPAISTMLTCAPSTA
jgi:hypothetical protein